MANQIKVFVSYSHKDKVLCQKLKNHLTPLRELIITWSDQEIIAGDEWDEAIRQDLKEAQIILLLISDDFIASTYITEVEVREAMERHESRKARVIPIILRPTAWEEMPYSKLEALPTDGKAVTTWDNRDTAFVDIVRGIKRTIQDLKAMQAGFASLSENGKRKQRFHEALLNLDYDDQVEAFRPFNEMEGREHLGAFIIHGAAAHGQIWLVNRLMNDAGIENASKNQFKFSFTTQGHSIEPKQLWYELGQWLNDKNPSHSAEAIIEQAYNLWQNRSFVLKISGIQYAKQDDIEEFLHTFWEELIKKIMDQTTRDKKPLDHYLLLFLIDNQGEVEKWERNWKKQFEAPAVPITLNKIEEFKPSDIENWIKGNKHNLPSKLKAEDALVGGRLIPEISLMQICTVCGYEWFDQEGVRL